MTTEHLLIAATVAALELSAAVVAAVEAVRAKGRAKLYWGATSAGCIAWGVYLVCKVLA